ncbi:hypothetical protein [Streptomyces sp. 2321.6]|nr:hypothetical protein [Streptomyces sp. 2321.6]
MNSAEPRDMGAASGTVTLLRTVGGSLGVALLGAVFTGRLHSGLADRLGEGAAGRLTARGGQLTPRALDGLAAPVREACRAAVTGGLHGVLAGAAVLAVLGFAAAWFVREAPLRSTVEPDGPATPHSPAEPTGPAHPHSPENAHSPAKPRP